MKSFSIKLLLLIFVPIIANAQQTWQSDLEQGEIRGNVKEIRQYFLREIPYLHADSLAKYKRQGKKPPYYDRVLDKLTQYNTDGYITFYQDGVFNTYYTKSYYAKGYIKEQVNYDKDGKVMYRYVFNYNSQGELYSAVRKSEKGVIFTEGYHSFYEQGTKYTTMMHVGTNGDNTVTELVFFPNGKLKTMLNKKNGMFQNRFDFNEQGEPTHTYFAQRDGSVVHRAMRKDGNVLYIEDVLEDGSKRLFTKKVFNAQGDAVEVTLYQPNGEIKNVDTMVYQYDSHGNWTRVERKINGQPSTIEEREIKYY